MRIKVDKKYNCAYVYIKHRIEDGEAVKTVRIREDLILDFDKNGKLLGIELLDADKYLPQQTIKAAIRT